MTSAEEKITRLIRQAGPITFERFMDIALYDEEAGYYRSGVARIGREGDFFTSSHLHPLFGAMVGRQIEEMWEVMGRPQDFTIVEMGAGAGYVCKDMLEYLRGHELFPTLSYVIVELSPASREGQEDLLRDFGGKVRWATSLLDVGEFKGCLFSNELLDAFPVHLVLREGQWQEVYVDREGDSFVERTGPLSNPEIGRYLERYAPEAGEGYRTEVNLRVRGWLRDVHKVLREGFLFTIDYGYPAWDFYGEDRERGTLMSYYRHEAHENTYIHVGEQDLTSHVNFSALRDWGEEKGFRIVGFCGQGAFLLSMGIDEEMVRLQEGTRDYPFQVARVKRMILPQGMGETHKVMIQYRGPLEPNLRGFRMRNRMRSL